MNRRTGTIAAGLILSASLFAACTLGVLTQTSYEVVFPSGVPSSFAYGSQKGDMLVRIANNPFAFPADDVNAAILAQMQGRTPGPPTRLSLEPTDRMIPGYAIALGFDLPVWYDPGALCRPGTAVPAANTSAPRLTLLMVFCEGDAELTWVKGSIPRAASADDPLFRQLIATSTFELIPRRDDQNQGTDFDAHRRGASLVAR